MSLSFQIIDPRARKRAVHRGIGLHLCRGLICDQDSLTESAGRRDTCVTPPGTELVEDFYEPGPAHQPLRRAWRTAKSFARAQLSYAAFELPCLIAGL